MYEELDTLKAMCVEHEKGGKARISKNGKPYFVVNLNGIGKRPVYKSNRLHTDKPALDIIHFAGNVIAKVAKDDKPLDIFFTLVSEGAVMEKTTL